jgi:hypothetical protein
MSDSERYDEGDDLYVPKTEEDLDSQQADELDRQVMLVFVGAIVFAGGIILALASTIV